MEKGSAVAMMTNVFDTQELSLGYGHSTIVDSLSTTIAAESITVLIGPNGCGKSTLLRGLARLLSSFSGQVLLNGEAIHRQSTKDVAKQLSVLPQSPTTFEGITVAELVSLGRYPHQSFFQQWSDTDQRALERALTQTQLTAFANHHVDALSGGQRQRAWIAMTLAQETATILLDEPTTYLDLAHQIDVLNLLKTLNIHDKRSIVMVLHDVNLACRYADEIIVLSDGHLVTRGVPDAVITPELMQSVFGLDCDVINDPISHTPMCIPHMANFTHNSRSLK